MPAIILLLLSSSQLLSKSSRSCSTPPDRPLVQQGAPECAQAGEDNTPAAGSREQPWVVHLLKWGAGKGPDAATSRAGPGRSLGHLPGV